MKPKVITAMVLALLVVLAAVLWWRQSSDEVPNESVDEEAIAEAEIIAQDEIAQQPTLDDELSELLETSDMSDPAVRARIVEQVRAREEAIRESTHAKAKRLGLPIREVYPDGTIIEIQGFDGDRPIYYTTDNVNAAISSGASQIRTKSPYDLTGSEVNVGVWDGGVALPEHQELNDGDVEIMDKELDRSREKANFGIEDHPTHVIGTITAKGVDARALGMAPSSKVKSYDWTFATSEMLLAGAASADGKIAVSISNHSYGTPSGYSWNRKESTWQTYDKGERFGRYDWYAREVDTVAYSVPYLSAFFSAGNDRNDDPKKGESVRYWVIKTPKQEAHLGQKQIFDPATFFKGDGEYRSGFENINGRNLAKNVITVGAVNDAVSGASRSLAGATMSDFSSWGPTDDGRIKPDIVANGVGVFSPISTDAKSYESWPGTSMATPSAAGSAALLAELYRKNISIKGRGTGFRMPSSLMKALLIHTADDLEPPGPDYSNGWGLINVKTAADIILDHKKDPERNPKLIEGTILANKRSFTHYFLSDGKTPLRATLCWTDPTGPVQSESDSRTSVLSHNLDLLVTGPNGEIHEPFTMPYVGDWRVAKMSAPATRGKNNTDNVEQVYDRAKPALNGAGLYKVTVSLDGSLKKGIAKQNFSLVLTGGIALPHNKSVIELDEGLNFGDVVAGNERTLNLKIRNVGAYAIMGEGDLNVTGIDFFGNSEMSSSFAEKLVIRPGSSETVAITYSPRVTAVRGSQPWFGTLRVLSDSAAGRTTVPMGRGVPGERTDAPQLRLPQPGVALDVNYIDEVVDSEWSYDWAAGETHTNRFAFNSDWTVRIIVFPNQNYRTTDIKAGYIWKPIGPNQISIYGPGKSEFSSDSRILKFISRSTFETTSYGRKIEGHRYPETKTRESYKQPELDGMTFLYGYEARQGSGFNGSLSVILPAPAQFSPGGTIKSWGMDDIYGLWDNVTWKHHAQNVVRLSNATTGKEMFMHLVPTAHGNSRGPAPSWKTYVAVGWEGNNVSGTIFRWDLKQTQKDLTKRHDSEIDGFFGGIKMVWKRPENDKGGYWEAKYKTTQKQWKTVMGKSSPQEGENGSAQKLTWEEVQEWVKRMTSLHPLPRGTAWSTKPKFPAGLLPGQKLPSLEQGFSATIVK